MLKTIGSNTNINYLLMTLITAGFILITFLMVKPDCSCCGLKCLCPINCSCCK